jgi:hypothetical protein
MGQVSPKSAEGHNTKPSEPHEADTDLLYGFRPNGELITYEQPQSFHRYSRRD